MQRINVLFRIDKQGNAAEIKAQSKYSDLVDEAERVVKKIPQMIPGKDKGKTVSVLYTLPILFEVC
jgi:protein TonB